MTDMTGGAGPEAGGAAGGGTPSESDLPRLQGLDQNTDDPDDPTAVQQNPTVPADQGLDQLTGAGDEEGPSDPMPDIAGTSG